MSYLYAVTSQRPTATNFSIVCNFTSPTDRNLILARGNYLEIHVLREGGLVPVLDVPMFGRIKALDCYRPVNSSQDVLFILIERKKFCILGYDAVKNTLITRSIGNVKDRIGRDVEMGQRGFVDPEGRMLGMILYDGLIKVVPIDQHGVKDAFNLTLEENRVLDMKFLHGCAKPTLVMLYEDNRRARHIKTWAIDARDKELTTGPWYQNNVEFGASILIPIPAPWYGVLVVGLSTISYISGTGNIQAIEISPCQICAYTRLDDQGSRYLLGDHRGQLMVVSLITDQNHRVQGIQTDILGTTSIAESINYLDNGVVFIGSCLGDSQLIKLHTPSSASAASSEQIEVLDCYTNIGPVVDMCIVDQEKNGGQKQIVTCSGAYKDGSLRIIRSGIGIHEQASLEIFGIRGVWSLRPEENAEYDKYLVQSFVSETRVLSIEGEELAEVEIGGFNNNQATIFCGNMASQILVQVTSNSIRLVDAISLGLIQEVNMDSKTITVASANLTQLVIAQSGGELSYYQLDAATRKLSLSQKIELDQDIACFSMQSSNSSNSGTEMEVDGNENVDTNSHLLAVGMWTDNTVRLLALPSLQEVHRVKLGTETQARDIVMASFPSQHYLFVGMGDGSLLTYMMESNADNGLPQLTHRKKGVLGRHPVSFTAFRSNEELCIFAACDRPTIIYMRNGKLLFSILDIRGHPEISYMTPFHSELFPDCLTLCSEEGLMIGTIEDIQKIHVQTIPLNEAPRRITHDSNSHCYVVCSEKTNVTDRGEETVNRVLFFDDGDMSQIGVHELDYLEQAISTTVCTFQDISKTFFIVGTGQLVNEELEPSRGRILIFEVTDDRKCILLAEKETKSAVFTLTSIDGKLAAGIGSKVQIFKLLMKDDGLHYELQNECSHQGHIMALFLKSHGDLLLVGDVVRSMTLLRYRSTESVLEEVARDYNTNYMRAIEIMDQMDDHFLGSDDHGNLFCLRRQTETASEEQQSKLEVRGEYHLGDYVNVLRRGSLVSQPIDVEASSASSSSANATGSSSSSAGGSNDILDADYKTVTGYPIDRYSVILATITGAIGNVLALSESSYKFFKAVEKAMKEVVKPVGNFPHEEWRNFQNEMRTSEQRNIVDGDLVEMILDLSKEDLELVTRKINDELGQIVGNASNNDSGATSSSKHVSTESASALIANLVNSRVNFTTEDILRRVEDISRLH